MGLFLAGKLLGLLTQPLLWVAALLALALLWQKRHPQRCRRAATWALGLLLVLGWMPAPDFFIRHLENQYAEIAPGADLESYAGVIILGGALDSGHIARDRLQPVLNDAAERMTAAVALSRRHAHLQLVFTGGEGELLAVGPNEADRARAFFESLGLTNGQVQFESSSRNTYENATLTATLPDVDIGQRWLLVTSAWHMPRAIATFQKVGWNVTAYPVDFRTGASTPWTNYSMSGGIHHWELLMHELLGLLAYRLTGRL